MTDRTYMARVSSKAGACLYESPPYPTRIEAARDALDAKPNAKGCSTSVAVEYKGEFRTFGKDIRWHSRSDVAASAITSGDGS